jgi:hypothetical protein
VDPNDGGTSLNEALTLANSNAGSDELVFDRELAGVATTLADQLVLSSAVTINGDTNRDGDADFAIDGSNEVSLVKVDAGVTAELKSLVLTGSGVVAP